MRLVNTTTAPIVILPGESVDVTRTEVRLDAERELKSISLDALADSYSVPPPSAIVYDDDPPTDDLGDGPPYGCPFPFCSYESTSKKGVRVHHSKIHGKPTDGTDPPKLTEECPECSAAFATTTGMKRHYSMIHGDRYDDVYGPARPFECPANDCDETFRTEHGASVHHGHVHA